MKKKEIEKNRLDLAYQRKLQLVNIVLFVGLGAIITYFASLISNPDKTYQYTIILVVLGILIYKFYSKFDKDLKNISNQIGQLAK